MESASEQQHRESLAERAAEATSASRGGKHAFFGVSILLAAAVLLVFGQTVRHEFVNYDDDQYVWGNPQVAKGLTVSGVVWAFTHSHSANWHPLTWISHMLDCELFGLKPGGHHLTNVLLHAANTVLLFLLVQKLTGAHWRSAFVAVLFALHPLHVESVAWVSERKDVLSGLFFMLTLLMYERYVRSAKCQVSGVRRLASRDYWLAVLFFALGLMSKPMLVTLPFVMLLLDWWPLHRVADSESRVSNWWRLVVEKGPFFALSVTSSIVTLAAQREAVHPLAHISMGIRAVNATLSYVRYLGKMFWPENLAIPYPHQGYGSFRWFCVSATLIVTVCLVAIRFRRRFPFLATGWLWYLGMLVPVIGLVQVGMQSMADRYTYLPLIGVFIMLVWGTAELFKRWQLPTAAVWGLALFVLGACTACTMIQLRYWMNSETLFRHAITATKGNDVAYYNLGEYYFTKGRLDEAMDNCLKAIEIRPSYDDALNNLGVVLALKGNLDEAIVRIREAIHYRPDKADAYYNLGNVQVMQRKLDEAVQSYNEALRLKPDYPEAHNNLANVLAMQGHAAEAVRHYQEALRLNPNHEGAKRQLRTLGAR